MVLIKQIPYVICRRVRLTGLAFVARFVVPLHLFTYSTTTLVEGPLHFWKPRQSGNLKA